MAKDERRLTSGDGHAVAAHLKALNNELAAGLLELQQQAFNKRDLKLAKQIADLMANPQRATELLDLWTNDDITGLIAQIKAGEK